MKYGNDMLKLSGKIISWNKQKAFGFIKPSGGGSDIFIHKKAFIDDQVTPKIDDVIEFTMSKDSQGRYCAVSACFKGKNIQKNKS